VAILHKGPKSRIWRAIPALPQVRTYSNRGPNGWFLNSLLGVLPDDIFVMAFADAKGRPATRQQHDAGAPAGSIAGTAHLLTGPNRCASIFITTAGKERLKKGNTMAWTTPILVEICIGLEINGYLPAEF
jgi:coenzyme PQQ precursor peptide PqqA